MTFLDSDIGKKVEKEHLVWWEKSVEYTFIAQMVKKKAFEHIVPLSGAAEAALSDALLKWGDKRLLIEFKRDVNAFESEHRKYVEDKKNSTAQEMRNFYEAAKKELNSLPGASAHGLIYGVEATGRLGLKATAYWTPSEGVDVDVWCETCGVDGAVLDDYLDRLSGLRFAEVKDGGEAGGSRSFVVAVSDNGGHFCCELSEYNNLRLKLKTVNASKKGPK